MRPLTKRPQNKASPWGRTIFVHRTDEMSPIFRGRLVHIKVFNFIIKSNIFTKASVQFLLLILKFSVRLLTHFRGPETLRPGPLTATGPEPPGRSRALKMLQLAELRSRSYITTIYQGADNGFGLKSSSNRRIYSIIDDGVRNVLLPTNFQSWRNWLMMGGKSSLN
jgi:hypothetical protein